MFDLVSARSRSRFPSVLTMLIVRPADRTEVDAAIKVWKAANSAGQLARHSERLKDWASASGAVLLVADNGITLIGMTLSLVGRADDGAGAPILGLRHLTGVAVIPEQQRSGVGGRLLDAALDHARTVGCDRVTLWADRMNAPAQRFFATRGFRPTGRTMPDEAGADMVHLAVKLGPTTGVRA
jgi:GNAT superfamily N-acetyltransferase